MIKPGMNLVIRKNVTEPCLASSVGSGSVPVLATPAMIAWMEEAASSLVSAYLDDGQTTVGTLVNIQHQSATPQGMQVDVKCVLTAVEGKLLRFSVEAFDEAGKIGEGIHERAIINAERFLNKANQKLDG